MTAKEATRFALTTTPFALTTRDIEKSSAENSEMHEIKSCLITEGGIN